MHVDDGSMHNDAKLFTMSVVMVYLWPSIFPLVLQPVDFNIATEVENCSMHIFMICKFLSFMLVLVSFMQLSTFLKKRHEWNVPLHGWILSLLSYRPYQFREVVQI